MEDTIRYAPTPIAVRATLEGGPESIPQSSRIQTVSPLDEKIKLPHYGGYEHFVRVGSLGEDSSAQQLIYRWITRTEMAE